MDKVKSSPQGPAGQKDNITPFRKDGRLAAVRAAKIGGLLLMLFTLAYGLWRYQDELELENIRRLATYLQAASSAGSESFTRYSFEPGLNTVYAPFELGLAVVSSDTYRFVSGFSETGFSYQLKYASPAIHTSRRQVLIYDQGNTGYCIANGYSIIYEGKSSAPIISASMNQNGDYALVTNEAGYRFAVYIYDYNSREKCVWQTPTYWVMSASVSPGRETFSALCLSESESRLVTQVRTYEIGEQEPLSVIELGEKTVYSLAHNKNGKLVIICEDGLYIYDIDGTREAYTSLSGIVRFAHTEEEMPLVAMASGASASGQQVRVAAFDDDGGIIFDRQIKGSLRDMDWSAGRGLLLFYDRLVIIDTAGLEHEVREAESAGARSVLCTPSGEGILVYSDRAEGFSLNSQ